MPMGWNISPSIWQSYINAILECLQSRKYCKAIKDDLLRGRLEAIQKLQSPTTVKGWRSFVGMVVF